MWPSSLLTSVQPKGTEHNRVQDVRTTQSDQTCQVELARSHLIPNKLLLVKVLFSIHKVLVVLQQGQIMTPLPVLVK